MGVGLAFLAMVAFAVNMIITRFAMARMPVESGFLVVLAINVAFPAALFAVELSVRAAPFVWDWKGGALFALGGIIGTFLGRRALFDTVHLLGPARASVFHSSSPAFALLGAWLLADERLGLYELGLVAAVWAGLWLTQPPVGSRAGDVRVTPEVLRKGLLVGLLAVAGFGFGNVVRGLAIRSWNEAVLGTLLASAAALLLQIAVTRDWRRIGAQLRAGGRSAMLLYLGCGITTSLGSIFVTLAMQRLEIGLAVLVVHTTPLVVFPVSVLLLKQRQALTPRTAAGTGLVLAGIAALFLR